MGKRLITGKLSFGNMTNDWPAILINDQNLALLYDINFYSGPFLFAELEQDLPKKEALSYLNMVGEKFDFFIYGGYISKYTALPFYNFAEKLSGKHVGFYLLDE